MTGNEALKIFESCSAILKGHFLLTSGRHSDTYMQCAKLFVNPEISKTICEELVKKLSGYKIDFVASPAIGGIIMGYEIARQLNVPNIFFERENNEMSLRRGFELPKNSNVLVVEDVVTTGGSVKEVIACVKALSSNVTVVASIVDRSKGEVSFGVDYINVIGMDIKSYEAENCPICKTGQKLVKPGSRNIK